MPISIPERSSIKKQDQWKPEHLYKNPAAWQMDRREMVDACRAFQRFQGKLDNRKTILNCLTLLFAEQKRFMRLSNYAHRKHDEDTRVPQYLGLKEVSDKLSTEFQQATAFIEPELLALPHEQLQALIEDKAFSDYNQYLKELLRKKPHVLSSAEEALLASASLMRNTGHNAFSVFSGADLFFPKITNEKGKSVELNQALFAQYRNSPHREVRKRAFETFFDTFARYRNTCAALLSAQINSNLIYAKARRYNTVLEAALDRDNLPTSIYRNMITAVHEHLPHLHRYLALRRKRLKVKQLHYYDLYPPLVDKVTLKYPYRAGCDLLLESLTPLGNNYVHDLAHGLNPKHGWIDPFPNQGKRSGAYMDGSAYDVHPYVLSNYLDDFDSLSTLAHEMGHAMHSFYSNRRQPYPKADYSIFVAEVASTLNEALLVKHLLRNERVTKRKLYLLGEQLEGFRTTLFRQAMFAEFELALYQRAEAGEALTAESMSQIYLDLARTYYGHDEKVVIVEDRYGIEWAYIPHFYYGYYVFQYVTGMTAALALTEQLLHEGEPARTRYQTRLLEAGCSDDPIAILRNAGVDLTTTKPYQVAMRSFASALDEMEALFG